MGEGWIGGLFESGIRTCPPPHEAFLSYPWWVWAVRTPSPLALVGGRDPPTKGSFSDPWRRDTCTSQVETYPILFENPTMHNPSTSLSGPPMEWNQIKPFISTG